MVITFVQNVDVTRASECVCFDDDAPRCEFRVEMKNNKNREVKFTRNIFVVCFTYKCSPPSISDDYVNAGGYDIHIAIYLKWYLAWE